MAMIRVSNGKCIRDLGRKSMAAAKARNIVAILAIALTTVLFTSLFTIALSINDGFQQNNFRQCGGWSHGGFKYLTQAQFEELRQDPLIKEWGLRRFCGMPREAPFQKSHVEIGYSDANQAHWMYCDPVEGRLPAEGTDEAATDLHVLELLGVEPRIGNPFTVTFQVDGHETTQTFTLCGWWERDPVIVASHILIPQSRVDAILDEVGTDPEQSGDGMTGSWNLDVMFQNSLHIARDMDRVLANHGYQSESPSDGDNYIATGVNWGYTGSQLTDSLDPATALGIAAILLLIVFTGYLIIYNVFQISVTNDIRFYGLLKTIGTTGRQLRRIIRQQALLLSLAGIPLGLLVGWFIGSRLTPVIIAQLNGIHSTVSVSPVIFLASALFSLLTVLLSCARPGRLAARVSPIEAVRYTEGGTPKKKMKKSGGVSLFAMAKANLGRSRSKTVVTVLSLSLAVVLLNLTVTFTNGFSMEKYLSNRIVSDYILADAGYFQVSSLWGADKALPEEIIDAVTARGGLAAGGRIYGLTIPVQEFVTEDRYRAHYGRWNSQEDLDQLVQWAEKHEGGLLADNAQLYGMDPFVLDKLTVLQGDLSRLREPEGNYIAAVYHEDDYGNPEMDSHWAGLGDTVTLRYVERFEYYNPDTGEVYSDGIPEGQPWRFRAASYRDVTYEVAALVSIPLSLSYRHFGNDQFVLGSGTFLRDTGTNSVMLYTFDMEDEAGNQAMELFLADYTENQNSQYDYESRATYAAELESFRTMFLLLGGVLSFIVGLVGILNFFNAILTGILTRRREFAVLQSIGMTGSQLKRMLISEGLLYTLGAVALSLGLTAALGPLTGSVLENLFWFFDYRFTVTPIALLAPVFALLGCLTPWAVYRFTRKSTIVERLREAES